jgi:aryl-phospho-beta-D-glucosidase BglC (GH1 family)
MAGTSLRLHALWSHRLPCSIPTVAGIRICSGSNPVKLHGINWFGFETGATFVDGLWQGPSSLTLDFINSVRRIKLLGFNTIRLPMSLKVRASSLL